MIKPASAKRTTKRQKTNRRNRWWFLVLFLALVGAMVAACSQEPIFWLLVWPTPLVLIFTGARLIHEGFHRRDGVLILGRPAYLPVKVQADVSNDTKNRSDYAMEDGAALVDPVLVFGRRQNVESKIRHGLMGSRHGRQKRSRTWLDRPPYILEKRTAN